MRILIAGATGILGIPITLQLIAAGHEVIVDWRYGSIRQDHAHIDLARLKRQSQARAWLGTADAELSRRSARCPGAARDNI